MPGVEFGQVRHACGYEAAGEDVEGEEDAVGNGEEANELFWCGGAAWDVRLLLLVPLLLLLWWWWWWWWSGYPG